MIAFIISIPILLFLVILCFYSSDEPSFPTDDIRRPDFYKLTTFSKYTEDVFSRFIIYENYASFLKKTAPNDSGNANYIFCFSLYFIYSFYTSPFYSNIVTIVVILAVSTAVYFICSFLYRRFFSFPYYDLSAEFLKKFASSNAISRYLLWYDDSEYISLLTSAGFSDYDPMSLYIVDCRSFYCSAVLESIIFRRRLRKFVIALIIVLYLGLVPLIA